MNRIRKPKTPEQKERDRERSKRIYQENKDNPEFLEKIKRNTRNWQLNNPERYLISASRWRAKKRGIPHNITKSDITIPKLCPILQIPMTVGEGGCKGTSPTLDRIIPELGYVKGNVQVISMKANLMKNNASREELIKFANWVLQNN